MIASSVMADEAIVTIRIRSVTTRSRSKIMPATPGKTSFPEATSSQARHNRAVGIRPHPLVEDVDVKHRHPALLLGEGELRAPVRIGVPLAGRPHQLELLRAAGRHHLRPP